MKNIKHYMGLIIIMVVTGSFSQCVSTKDIQEKSPVEIGEVYFQRWIGGVEGGGSGLNILIAAKDSTVVLDSVYFQGKVAKLEVKDQNKLLYIGRFVSELNQKKNMVYGKEPKEDNGNETPIERAIPFELKKNECVVSYQDNKIIKYFKIENVVEKEMIAYPSAPPNKQ